MLSSSILMHRGDFRTERIEESVDQNDVASSQYKAARKSLRRAIKNSKTLKWKEIYNEINEDPRTGV